MSNEEPLFKGVRYHVIGSIDENVEILLADGKAKKESYLTGLSTHALVTDYDNVEVEEARIVWQIPVVTPRWVELSNKCKKLLPTEAFAPSNSQLFSGVVVCPSRMPKSDRDLIWALTTFFGGECQLQLDGSCTHLIVSEPCGKKYDEALKHIDKIAIVTPDWLSDSVKLKSRQDVKKYNPALAIIPMQRNPIKDEGIPSSEDTAQESTDNGYQNSDIITSSLQNLDVSKVIVSPQTQSKTNADGLLLPVSSSKSYQTMPGSQSNTSQIQAGTTTPLGLAKSTIAPGVTASSVGMQMSMPSGTMMQPDKNQFQPTGQTIISQPGQIIMSPQQLMQHQISPMTMQQFQQQRSPMSGAATTRFSIPNVPQRFQGPNQQNARQPSPSPKKPATKRRRSSSRSKNATSPAASGTIPSSPIHGNQMGNVMMSQQQLSNTLMQQNQQQLLNQQRMAMMQSGQLGQGNFIQQQMMQQQQQHVARMQGVKGPVTPTSPQKIHGPHMIGDQTSGVTGMRPGFPVNFQNNAMRMQQHQSRPAQNQPQLSPQQMMAMGFNPQMQVPQQGQVKMSTMGMQQPQQQFFQQQQQPGAVMSMTLPLQNQQQAVTSNMKMTPQKLQASPQQQGMFIQSRMNKQPGENVPPHQPSSMTQQQIIQQQTGMTQQQRQQQQQQQLMMQQLMQQQFNMQQQQQQLIQSPNNMQQKLTTPPSSHGQVNVGADVISPTALQQGLLLAQAQQNQAFQQPLIHPSLQTPPQDYGKASQQGGVAKSRRTKTKKPKDGDENSEGKAKPRSRSRAKKSTQSPAASSPNSKKLLNSPSAGSGQGGKGVFSPMMNSNQPMGYYPASMNVMTPPPHPTVPVAFSTNKPCFPSPTATVSPLAATENMYNAPHLIATPGRMTTPPQQTTPKMETRYLAQYKPSPTPPPTPRGPFYNPLNAVPKSYDGCYFGHDPAENVPQDLCLLGCVFVIMEYQESVPNIKIIDHWKKVISKFGGIVEEEYNTCTCTHLLCISQTTSLYRDSLLEGKRCVTVYWLNDVLQIRELRPPWLALHLPTPYSPAKKPATKHTISYTGFHQKERERLKMMASVCGAKFSGFLSRSNSVLVCKGTLSLKYDKAREWKIPCVNVHWLRDVMMNDVEALNNPNQPKYQKFDENAVDNFGMDEMKVQKILDPWKVPVRVTLDCMQRARVKRRNSTNDSAVSTPALKRSRIEGSYQPLPRVCFTGLPGAQVVELQKSLESLQGQISKTVNHSTHLVANSVSRTVKFLCAISVCQYIVTPEWIKESAKSNWLLDEEKYLLHDKNAEERFQFSLKESLSRARENQLFKGYVFCVTENVKPTRKILREIVECAGGKVMDKIPTTQLLKGLKLRRPPNNRLLLISCPADEQQVIHWKSEGITVHNAEIILSGVLKQEVNETLYQL